MTYKMHNNQIGKNELAEIIYEVSDYEIESKDIKRVWFIDRQDGRWVAPHFNVQVSENGSTEIYQVYLETEKTIDGIMQALVIR